jgi:predicted TPR repeat methyltransferase
MDAYTEFARVYDDLMEDVPYDEWCGKILDRLKKENITDGLVLDLGCGSGTMTEMLADAGYDMIGIDISVEMLEQAEDKKTASGHDILYICQDMREFELYGTVGAVVSVCDSINYLTNQSDLLTVMKLVNNYLDPKGLFIFDVKTEHYFKKLGSSTIAENREEGSFIWENDYDESTRDNFYYLTIYEENDEGTFDRYEEEHLQHAFTIDEVKSAIKESGLQLLEVLDVSTMKAPTEDSDRLYFIAREVTK